MLERATIRRIKLENFRRFSSLDLFLPEGLILFYGPNGSGKSTIPLALQYLLFGRAGKLTKKDLVSWDSQEDIPPKVEVSFSNGVTIKRGKRLSIKDNTDKTISVREHKFFKFLVENTQFSFLTPEYATFVDLTPTERRNLLVRIIPDLKIITTDVDKRLSNLSSNTLSLIRRVEQRKAKLEGSIKATSIALDEITLEVEKAKETLTQLEEKLKSLYEEREALKQALSSFDEEDIKALLNEEKQLNIEIKSLQENISLLEAEIKRYQKYHNLIGTLQQKLNSLILDVEQAKKSIQEKRCSWCGSKLKIENISQLHDVSKDKERLIERTKEQIKACQEKLQELTSLEKDLEALKENLVIRQKRLEEIQAHLYTYKDTYSRYNHMHDIIIHTENAYNRVKQTIEKSKTVRSYKKRLRKLTEKESQVTRKLSALEGVFRIFSTAQEFIRRELVDLYLDGVCEVLTRETNKLLRDTGFEVLIIPEEGKVDLLVNGKPFHVYSSGEKQRVRVATTLAFTSLSNKAGFIFIDEVFDRHLDKEGLEFLSLVLREYLSFPQIIVTTHNDYLAEALAPTEVVTFGEV